MPLGRRSFRMTRPTVVLMYCRLKAVYSVCKMSDRHRPCEVHHVTGIAQPVGVSVSRLGFQCGSTSSMLGNVRLHPRAGLPLVR